MIKSFLLLFISFCFFQNLEAKEGFVKVIGKVYENGNRDEPIENAEIIFLSEVDTIAKFTSDSTGNYYGKIYAKRGNCYKVKIAHKYYSERIFEHTIQDLNATIKYDCGLLRKYVETGPLLYEFNKVDMTEEFDFAYLKFQTKKLKKVCMEFVHYRLPDESYQVAIDRIVFFKMKMLENGFENNQFTLLLRTVDCKTARRCQATTEGSLESVASNCD